MRTIILLFASNVFMTFAWYYHLKHQGWPLWKAILISWFIALFEYCLMVPANRFGKGDGFSLFQLKMIQEAITLIIFCVFAVWIMKEPFQWRYIVSFAFLMGAVYFMFSKQPV
ncbi:MAG TPA: DMT family protein [Chitinophagaceae bacterium]|nr:DMT family protein [Chitinophagaceae bacterium]